MRMPIYGSVIGDATIGYEIRDLKTTPDSNYMSDNYVQTRDGKKSSSAELFTGCNDISYKEVSDFKRREHLFFP